eukprot:4661950-Pyramimonas_sp.AAC.1
MWGEFAARVAEGEPPAPGDGEGWGALAAARAGAEEAGGEEAQQQEQEAAVGEGDPLLVAPSWFDLQQPQR